MDDIHLEDAGCSAPETNTNEFSESDSEVSEESDDNEESTTEKRASKKKTYKREASKLPSHIKGLMGEANLRYARGDFETAKKMCFEVIRQAPDAYEPYLTLAQMYENNNIKKCKAFLMLASHLQPSNASIWCRLADISLQENCPSEAVEFYSKAISAEPKDISLHLAKLELLEKQGDTKAILLCKKRMANKMSKKQHETIINTCMDVAKEYYVQKNYIRAIEALIIPIKRIPNKVSKDLLNMTLELLLLSERFSECIDIFTRFCRFTFDLTVAEDSTFIVNSYMMPDSLPVDIKFKFIICLVRLHCTELIGDLIDKVLIEDDVEMFGDLYLDLVEALMITNYHNLALKLTVPLVKSKNYSLAAVWLKHAECLSYCEMYDQAVEAYFTVMALAPRHVEVLYPLAMLLLRQNKKEEALEVLSQDLSTNKIDVAVLIEQMKLLKQIGDLENYWKCCEMLLSRHCVVVRNYEELKMVSTSATYREKIAKIKRMRAFRGQDAEDVESTLESIREPSVEDEYRIYREILQFAFEKKEYALFQKFAFMGLCSKRFTKFCDEIFLVAYYSCIFNKDFFHGYSTIRELIIHHPNHNLVWNWFSVIIQTPQEVRHQRFIDRFQHRFSQNGKMVLANYNASVGNFTESLASFTREFKRTKSSYCAFMLGVIMSQMYCQRQVDKNLKKMLAETVTYLFLNYAKSRSKYAKQEVYYNLGRMYQQLGVMYLAEHFYKKVLKEENAILTKNPEILDLKREAAYNLHIIYKNNGNLIAARKIIMENIVI